MTLSIATNVPLAPRTTLGLGGPARRHVRATTLADLEAVLADADAAGEPVLVLGGGSNLVVRDGGFPGLVIELATRGVDITPDPASPEHALVTVAAGVPWDELVAELVEAGLAGVECLAGIPGSTGATPIQNVGAYGQEVADVITRVDVIDREAAAGARHVSLAPAACGFAYRASVFKHVPRWVVTGVELRLLRSALGASIRYPELCKALGIADGGQAPLADVRRTVIELRRGKGMVVDPADPASRSAGSFFTNPIVDDAALAEVLARLPAGVTMPRFAGPAPGLTKLSAAWLIERAGFPRGTERGAVGTSPKHALALINRGGGTATALLALAREIQAGVLDQLGVQLEPEPVIVGVD